MSSASIIQLAWQMPRTNREGAFLNIKCLELSHAVLLRTVACLIFERVSSEGRRVRKLGQWTFDKWNRFGADIVRL